MCLFARESEVEEHPEAVAAALKTILKIENESRESRRIKIADDEHGNETVEKIRQSVRQSIANQHFQIPILSPLATLPEIPSDTVDKRHTAAGKADTERIMVIYKSWK